MTPPDSVPVGGSSYNRSDRVSRGESDDDESSSRPRTTPASPEAIRNTLARIDTIDARGITNQADGWRASAGQIEGYASGETIDRCLLLTDGLANVGTTDPDELVHHAAELARRGVSTTAFGLGADFDEDLLRRMAVRGGGNFTFVERAEQIPDFFTSELGETLEVVARDVALVLGAPEGVRVESLTPVREASRADGEWIYPLGDLVARQELEHLFRLDFPALEEGRSVPIPVFLTVEGKTHASDGVEWTAADRDQNREQPRDRDVDRRGATT